MPELRIRDIDPEINKAIKEYSEEHNQSIKETGQTFLETALIKKGIKKPKQSQTYRNTGNIAGTIGVAYLPLSILLMSGEILAVSLTVLIVAGVLHGLAGLYEEYDEEPLAFGWNYLKQKYT